MVRIWSIKILLARPAITTSGLKTAGWALVEVGIIVTVDQSFCSMLITSPRRRPGPPSSVHCPIRELLAGLGRVWVPLAPLVYRWYRPGEGEGWWARVFPLPSCAPGGSAWE